MVKMSEMCPQTSDSTVDVSIPMTEKKTGF